MKLWKKSRRNFDFLLKREDIGNLWRHWTESVRKNLRVGDSCRGSQGDYLGGEFRLEWRWRGGDLTSNLTWNKSNPAVHFSSGQQPASQVKYSPALESPACLSERRWVVCREDCLPWATSPLLSSLWTR